MKLHYYADTDSLYVEVKSSRGAERATLRTGSTSTLMPMKHVVGFNSDHASMRLDFSTLETRALPIQRVQGRVRAFRPDAAA